MTASAIKSKATVRQLASEILVKVDTENAYLDALLEKIFLSAGLEERDRALLTEITYGTLRWRGSIDARLAKHLRRPLEELDPPIRSLLRLTGYQLLYLSRVPPYAAVNEAVEIAKLRGGQKVGGFVNALLRNLLRERDVAIELPRDPVSALAIQYSHPEWLVRRWIDQFGIDQAVALFKANNEKPALVVRANRIKCTRDQLLERFTRAGIDVVPVSFAPDGVAVAGGGLVEKLPGFAEGQFQVQGAASQLLGYLVGPLPGERILDACAAPGGKSTHMAEIMGDRGEIVAIDKSASGVEKIRDNSGRLGLRSISAVAADAAQPLGAIAAPGFDRVLVDAPCSGLGTLRTHPEIKWRRVEADIRRLARLQLEILGSAAAYLRPGGILVFSTCTLAREENEHNVQAFLAEHREFELQEAAGYLPSHAAHMVSGPFFQALPHRDDTDGFFAARLRRKIN